MKKFCLIIISYFIICNVLGEKILFSHNERIRYQKEFNLSTDNFIYNVTRLTLNMNEYKTIVIIFKYSNKTIYDIRACDEVLDGTHFLLKTTDHGIFFDIRDINEMHKFILSGRNSYILLTYDGFVYIDKFKVGYDILLSIKKLERRFDKVVYRGLILNKKECENLITAFNQWTSSIIC